MKLLLSSGKTASLDYLHDADGEDDGVFGLLGGHTDWSVLVVRTMAIRLTFPKLIEMFSEGFNRLVAGQTAQANAEILQSLFDVANHGAQGRPFVVGADNERSAASTARTASR